MKQILLLLAASFSVAFVIGSRPDSTPSEMLTPGCYISCFNGDVTEQFIRQDADARFASWHTAPNQFVLADPKGKRVRFKSPDGKDAMGYLIKSKKPSHKYILVIQEWWGLNDYIKNEADKLAAEFPGANILALDMYDGKVASTPDSAMAYMKSMSIERLKNIARAGIMYGGKKADIYTVGWCFGGMWSLQTALLAGDQAKGCIMYYGRPENDVEKLKSLRCDVIGFFGLQDKMPSPEVVMQFEKDMISAGKTLTTYNYEAPHAFANPSNPKYNPEATKDAYEKSVAFLKARM